MKFYFKQFIPIHIVGDHICIGFFHEKNKVVKGYIEIKNDFQNYSIIEKLIEEGIDVKSNNSVLISCLYEKGFLTKKVPVDNRKVIRGDLFLEYLIHKENKNEQKVDLNYKLKKILIYGAGGGGSTLIYMLAQFGFRNITIVDFDIVEESDIGRVLTFRKKDIGKSKIITLKEEIKDNFNIDINIISSNHIDRKSIEKIILKVKPYIFIKACDPDESFVINLNKICFKYNIPYFIMGYSYEKIGLGPIFIPEMTGCYSSLEIITKDYYGDKYNSDNMRRIFNNKIIHPSVSFNINIISSLAFKEILFFLLEKYQYCQTIGRQIIFNTLNFQFSSFLVKCDKSCEICNS